MNHAQLIIAPRPERQRGVPGASVPANDAKPAVVARAEAARLAESESRLRSLADTMPALLWMVDAKRSHLFKNQAWLDFFGVEPGALSDHVWDAALHPEDRDRVLALYRDVQFRQVAYRIDCRVRRKDGAWRWIEEIGTPRFGPNGFEGYTGASVDVTERRDLENQLHRAQKMEAIGQLTGGLAHDFNNICGIILGNLDLLQERLASDDESAELVKEALDAAQRGAELNRQLLAFSRRQPLRATIANVEATIQGLSNILRHTLGEAITVRTLVHDGYWPVLVDQAQLESAILNLAVNGRDAMPDGGTLTIEVTHTALDGPYLASHAEAVVGDHVVIAVSDTGAGMPAEVLARAFEPFFTTKSGRGGTGLGLAMVHGFMRQSGGHATIYSEQAHGTTVKLYFPRARALPRARASEPAAPAANENRGHERILVVEDDAGMRRTSLRQLRGLGYRTLEAENAVAAMAILLGEEPIELLLTDVVMPGGMDGHALALEARKLRPGVKVLFISGFTAAAATAQAPEFVDHLLTKPYRKADLARMVRTILAEGVER